MQIKLDAFRPYHHRTRQVQVEEKDQAWFFINYEPVCKFVSVPCKLGRLHFVIQLDNQSSQKRHSYQ